MGQTVCLGKAGGLLMMGKPCLMASPFVVNGVEESKFTVRSVADPISPAGANHHVDVALTVNL